MAGTPLRVGPQERDITGNANSGPLERGITGSSTRSVVSKGSFNHRPTSTSVIAAAFLGDDEAESLDGDQTRRACGCLWTASMRALLFTGGVNLIISIAQFVAAELANSDALLADSVAGFVDSFTYFLNIGVEALKGKVGHRTAELLVPVFSIGLLTFLTIDVMLDAIFVLQGGYDGETTDEVDPWIVLLFTIPGLIFVVGAMYLFRRNLQRDSAQLSVNMKAAFLNLGADFLRSVVTLLEAVLIIGFEFDGAITDAWACIFVSGTILLGAVYAVYEWLVDVHTGPAAWGSFTV